MVRERLHDGDERTSDGGARLTTPDAVAIEFKIKSWPKLEKVISPFISLIKPIPSRGRKRQSGIEVDNLIITSAQPFHNPYRE